jgi:hypothetical protein
MCVGMYLFAYVSEGGGKRWHRSRRRTQGAQHVVHGVLAAPRLGLQRFD